MLPDRCVAPAWSVALRTPESAKRELPVWKTALRSGARLIVLGHLCLAVCLFAVLETRAHDAGLSTATVLWESGRMDASLTFALQDAGQLAALDADQDGKISPAEFATGRAELGRRVAVSFQVRQEGKTHTPESVGCRLDENNNVEVKLLFSALTSGPATIQSKLLGSLAGGHRQLLSVREPGGRSLASRLLHAKEDSALVTPPDEAAAASALAAPARFAGFVALGVKHIWTGYDHLLFLFALLVVTRRLADALKIITCFTLAHSITLALATFNFVAVPARVVEPLIAASIVYVGLENLRRGGEPRGRWLLTFVFGLIHGFGFASVLREMGVGTDGGGVALPLFSFNLGVELGQLAVAALLLPLIAWCRSRPVFVTRWVPACSVVVALAGGFWFAQRVLGY